MEIAGNLLVKSLCLTLQCSSEWTFEMLSHMNSTWTAPHMASRRRRCACSLKDESCPALEKNGKGCLQIFAKVS